MFVLRVKVIPKSSRDQFIKEDSGIKLKITAPPIDGAANKHIFSFLSKAFGISKSRIKLVSGEKSKNKCFCLDGISDEEGLKQLESLY